MKVYISADAGNGSYSGRGLGIKKMGYLDFNPKPFQNLVGFEKKLA